jgi:parallel beta-helix repeat protein
MRFIVVALFILPVNCIAQTDFCQTLNTAMSALGAAGGVVDMRSVAGTQACLTDPFSTPTQIAAPITLLLGNVTVNVTARTVYSSYVTLAWRVPGNISILGTPSAVPVGTFGISSGTVLNFLPTAPVTSAIGLLGGQVDVGYFSAIGNSNVGRLIDARAQSYVRIHNLSLSTAGYIPPSGPNAGIAAGTGGTDVWISDNTITKIGVPASVNSASSDIYVDTSATGNPHYHIRNNQISGSSANISIVCFDCVDSDAIGNQVDQNNSISDAKISGGYGIAFYVVSAGSVQNIRIDGNNVTNTAGSGIYCVGCSHTSISNNVVSHVAQQQWDTSLPVGCVSVNGFDHGSVVGNVCYGSVKDGFSIASAGYTPLIAGSVFSGNTVHNVAGNGFNFRSNSILKNFAVTDNTVDQVPGASLNAFSIFTGVTVQSAIFTGNNASGGTYNLTACSSCVIANNL